MLTDKGRHPPRRLPVRAPAERQAADRPPAEAAEGAQQEVQAPDETVEGEGAESTAPTGRSLRPRRWRGSRPGRTTRAPPTRPTRATSAPGSTTSRATRRRPPICTRCSAPATACPCRRVSRPARRTWSWCWGRTPRASPRSARRTSWLSSCPGHGAQHGLPGRIRRGRPSRPPAGALPSAVFGTSEQCSDQPYPSYQPNGFCEFSAAQPVRAYHLNASSAGGGATRLRLLPDHTGRLLGDRGDPLHRRSHLAESERDADT